MKNKYLTPKLLFIIIFHFFIYASLCGQKGQFLYSRVDTTGILTKYGYSNAAKMVIPYGKYPFIYSDTIKTIGFVLKKNEGVIAINTKGMELFQVFTFDNGPDYISEGLFRIVGKHQKIGFANMNGQIVIKPEYDAAYPFTEGKALVCKGCLVQKEGEHSSWTGGKWGVINKKGNMLTPYIYDSVIVSANGIKGFIKSNGKWVKKSIL